MKHFEVPISEKSAYVDRFLRNRCEEMYEYKHFDGVAYPGFTPAAIDSKALVPSERGAPWETCE